MYQLNNCDVIDFYYYFTIVLIYNFEHKILWVIIDAELVLKYEIVRNNHIVLCTSNSFINIFSVQ